MCWLPGLVSLPGEHLQSSPLRRIGNQDLQPLVPGLFSLRAQHPEASGSLVPGRLRAEEIPGSRISLELLLAGSTQLGGPFLVRIPGALLLALLKDPAATAMRPQLLNSFARLMLTALHLLSGLRGVKRTV